MFPTLCENKILIRCVAEGRISHKSYVDSWSFRYRGQMNVQISLEDKIFSFHHSPCIFIPQICYSTSNLFTKNIDQICCVTHAITSTTNLFNPIFLCCHGSISKCWYEYFGALSLYAVCVWAAIVFYHYFLMCILFQRLIALTQLMPTTLLMKTTSF